MKTRKLGRSDLELSPFGLLVAEAQTAPAPPEVPNWCDIPAELDATDWMRVTRSTRPNSIVVARVGPKAWDRSMLTVCADLLKRIGRERIDVWHLSMLDVERVKAGEPFRMMIRLKEQGHIQFLSIGVSTIDDARWAIEHTPVHSVTIDVEYDTKTWKELLKSAEEAGTGVIGTTRTAGSELSHARELLASTAITAFSWPARMH